MENLPTWLTNVITGAIIAGFTWWLSRRQYKASVASTDASTLSTMVDVSANLAKQLKAVEAEVPKWKRQIADAIARAELCEDQQKAAVQIREEAQIIVEALSGLHYISDPDEPPTNFERRLKAAKQAGKRIAAIVMPKAEWSNGDTNSQEVQ